jgi:hypothetical protein
MFYSLFLYLKFLKGEIIIMENIINIWQKKNNKIGENQEKFKVKNRRAFRSGFTKFKIFFSVTVGLILFHLVVVSIIFLIAKTILNITV